MMVWVYTNYFVWKNKGFAIQNVISAGIFACLKTVHFVVAYIKHSATPYITALAGFLEQICYYSILYYLPKCTPIILELL